VKTTVAAAITQLLAQPETADLGRELEAEYARLRQRATRISRWIVTGMVIVALAVGFIVVGGGSDGGIAGVFNVIVALLFQLIFAAGVPALVVLATTIATFVQVRNLYLRSRLGAFLDARSDLSPHVADARQTITTKPAEALSRSLAIAVPLGLVATGLTWAGLIWLAASGALISLLLPTTAKAL